jgi:hypothetical protein
VNGGFFPVVNSRAVRRVRLRPDGNVDAVIRVGHGRSSAETTRRPKRRRGDRTCAYLDRIARFDDSMVFGLGTTFSVSGGSHRLVFTGEGRDIDLGAHSAAEFARLLIQARHALEP